MLGKCHTYLQIDKTVNLYFLNWQSLVKDLLCPSRSIWLSSYLLADVLVALLLPLPMLLTNCLLTASECMNNTTVLKGVDTPSQVRGKKICSLLCMSTGEAPACQSAFSVANSWATGYRETLYRDKSVEQLGYPMLLNLLWSYCTRATNDKWINKLKSQSQIKKL